jgi:hypothetical protein
MKTLLTLFVITGLCIAAEAPKPSAELTEGEKQALQILTLQQRNIKLEAEAELAKVQAEFAGKYAAVCKAHGIESADDCTIDTKTAKWKATRKPIAAEKK